MKIGVNARLLTNPYTGIGQYTYNLLRELAEIDKENEYILVVHKMPEYELVADFGHNVRIHVLPETARGGAGVKKTWWEQAQVPQYFVKEKVDKAFFTYPCNPWNEKWYKNGIETIVTVHDCIPWKNKRYRSGVLSKMYHLQTKKNLKKADKIFTVSMYSRDDILEYCNVDKYKISVVYNDAGKEFNKVVSGEVVKEVLDKYELKKGKYFLYCGGFDERKNVSRLVEEFLHYSREDKAGMKLVLCGNPHFKHKLYENLGKFVSKSGDKIVRTGFVEGEELKALYKGSRAFVHLSKEEGFNIPIVEAANMGAPLVLSDIDVHKEIAGNNALYVDLKVKGDGASAMERMLDDSVYDDYSKRAKELAEKYSWSSTAQKVKEVIFSERKK